MGKRAFKFFCIFSVLTVIATVSLLLSETPVHASPDEGVDNLQDEIADRKSEIEQINRRMDEYKQKIDEYSRQTASLLNDISLIENQITLAELDVQVTQAEIETKQMEIELIEEQIRQESERLQSQKAMLREMIFALHRRDNVGFIEVLFGANDFSELFEDLDHLESVNRDLNEAMSVTQNTKQTLEKNQTDQEANLDDLVALQGDLKIQAAKLENQRASKDYLVAETQSSEAQYRVLMSELRQESQYITSQISQLQAELEDRLFEETGESSDSSDGVLFMSPIDAYVTTATFHDPTYPFRHLWEHSGHDLAAPSGTPIRASADGIVAWTRTGNSYGNYVMVIHEGGYATLYAHMSRFNTSADAFVKRGDVIGYVGSTGFSTGPHLHFEVRLNGIPVDPRTYVPGL